MSEYSLNWEKIFDRLSPKLETFLKAGVVDDTGELAKSIEGVQTIKGKELVMMCLTYGLYLDSGTLPHWTSHKNLVGWCQRQLVSTGATYNGKTLDAEEWSYVIQHAIAKNGTKPWPWIRNVVDNDFERLLIESIHELGEDALVLEE